MKHRAGARLGLAALTVISLVVWPLASAVASAADPARAGPNIGFNSRQERRGQR
jgi:hypothetical protein